MAGSMNKANQRQTKANEQYYKRQFDKTPINKAVTMAKHIANFKDSKQFDRLKQLPKALLKQAADKVKGTRAETVLRQAFA